MEVPRLLAAAVRSNSKAPRLQSSLNAASTGPNEWQEAIVETNCNGESASKAGAAPRSLLNAMLEDVETPFSLVVTSSAVPSLKDLVKTRGTTTSFWHN